MILVRRGDQGATVAVMQVILNRLSGSSAEPLVLDGQFGANTVRSVQEFQRTHGLNASGTIDPPTWHAFRRLGNYQIIDIVDLAYNDVLRIMGGETGLRRWTKERFEQVNSTNSPAQIQAAIEKYVRLVVREAQYNGGFFRRIESMGGNPVAVRNPARAYQDIATGIRERAQNKETVLIRFQGHGSSYGQGIAGSIEGIVRFTADQAGIGFLNGIWDDESPQNSPALIEQIRQHLVPWAALEMHGCHVGGRREHGRYVRNRANAFNYASFFMLPVTASPEPQYWSSARRRTGDLRIEGRWVSTTPTGTNLRQWFDRTSQS